jgi:hypothetical protein
MAKDAPLFKPWRDGFLENLIKGFGIAMAFLIISGILGADYNPNHTNPYLWGLYIRSIPSRIVNFVQ